MVAATALDPTRGTESKLAAEGDAQVAEVCAEQQQQSTSTGVRESDGKCEPTSGQTGQQQEDRALDVPTPSSGQAAKRRWLDGGYTGPENKLFKTEMCWYAADCRHGAKCLFAHNIDELRAATKEQRTAPPQKQRWTSDYGWKRKELCTFFQKGCCSYDDYTCFFRHDPPPEEKCLKTMLCKDFLESATCSRDNCTDAHGEHELQIPAEFEGAPGYKTCLCTFFVLDELQCDETNCFDAHGELDLRRIPLSIPRALARAGTEFQYSDAHVHLDHVLLTRRYGNRWYYKREWCRFKSCFRPDKCLRAHSAADKKPPLPVEHCDFNSWATEIQAVPAASFRGCVHSCCEAHSIELTLKLVRWGREVLDGRVFAAFGIHPVSFKSYTLEVEEKLLAALEECGPQGVAWGECGLDYYRLYGDLQMSGDVREQMKEVFIRQVQLAARRDLPLVVHSRDAEEDTFAVLLEHLPREHPVYFHSYTGAVEIIQRYLTGWPRSYIGITGCVSYSTAVALQDIARATPLERLLLETDGPYMAPTPYRGEASHPGYIPWVAEAVARAKGVSALEVLAASHKNFCQFYRI